MVSIKEHGRWVTLSEWLCECADQTCTEKIELTPQHYEKIREQSTHFIVALGNKHVVSRWATSMSSSPSSELSSNITGTESSRRRARPLPLPNSSIHAQPTDRRN